MRNSVAGKRLLAHLPETGEAQGLRHAGGILFAAVMAVIFKVIGISVAHPNPMALAAQRFVGIKVHRLGATDAMA